MAHSVAHERFTHERFTEKRLLKNSFEGSASSLMYLSSVYISFFHALGSGVSITFICILLVELQRYFKFKVWQEKEPWAEASSPVYVVF